MKNSLKKIISLLLCAVMIAGTVCLVPASELSASAIELLPRGGVQTGDISKDSHSSVKYTYDTSTRKLVIYGEGEMKDFEFSAPWLGARVDNSSPYSPISVEVRVGVENIGENAFAYCDQLTNVSMAYTVTKIGSGAFSVCESLSEILLHDTLVEIGQEAFSGSGLVNVTIPDSVRIIGDYVFQDCKELQNVSMGNNFHANEIKHMFNRCDSIETLTVPGCINTIGSYFCGTAPSLKTVIIEDGVKEIEAFAFRDCNKLSLVVIPDSVTYISDGAFYNNYSGKPTIILSGKKGGIAEQYAKDHDGFTFVSRYYDDDMSFNIRYYDMHGVEITSIPAKFGEDTPLITPPVHDGYIFCGWYNSQLCNGKRLYPEHSIVSGYKSYYAKYVHDGTRLRIGFNTDIFSYPNFATNAFIAGAYFDCLMDNAGRADKRILKKKDINGHTGGVCFGLSSLVILSKLNKLDLKYFNTSCLADFGYECLNGMPNYVSNSNYVDFNTAQLVMYYYFAQHIGSSRKARKAYNAYEYVNIRSMIRKIVSTKEPLLLCFDTEGKGKGGHAIVLYDYKYNSDGTTTIFAWDPNCHIRRVEIIVNTNWTRASFYVRDDDGQLYPIYNENGGTFIKSVLSAGSSFGETDVISYIKSHDGYYGYHGDANGGEDETYSDTYFTVNYDDFTIETSNGRKATVADRDYASGDAELIEWLGSADDDNVTNNQLYRVNGLADGETYTIKPVADSSISEYVTFFENGEYSLSSVEAEAPVTMEFADDGSVETSAESPVMQTVSTVLENSTTKWFTTEFEANTTGLIVTPTADNTTVESKSDCSIKTTTMDEYCDVEKTLTATANTEWTISEDSGNVNFAEEGVSGSENVQFPYKARFVSNCVTQCEAQVNLSYGDLLIEPSVVNPGYTVEWYDNADFNGNAWNFASDTITGDTVLYAKWTKDSSSWCTLTYYSDNVQYTTRDVLKNSLSVKLAAAPEKDGHIFTGWFSDEACTTPITSNTYFSNNSKLYAGWKKVGTVAIDANDTSAVYGNNGSYDSFGLSGIQIKILESDTDAYGNGLRFCLTLDKQLYTDLITMYGENNIVFGNVVALKDNLNGVESMTLKTPNVIDSPSKNIFYDGENYQVATTLIHHIPKENYATNIAARSYIKYTDYNGNEQVYYFTETQSSSVCAKGYYTSIKTAADYILKNDAQRYSQSAIEYLQSIINS